MLISVSLRVGNVELIVKYNYSFGLAKNDLRVQKKEDILPEMLIHLQKGD